MKKINNQGMSLIGVLISASVGLVIVLGIGKALVQFSNQAVKSSRARTVNDIKTNVFSLLKSRKAWVSSVNRKKCPPGAKGCELSLRYNPANPVDQSNYDTSAKIWACPSKDGNALAFFNDNGQPLLINSASICNSCKSKPDSDNCMVKSMGLRVEDYVRVKINKPPGAITSNVLPSFEFQIQDFAGTKKVDNFSVLDSQMLFNPRSGPCPSGFVMNGYKDSEGTPNCVNRVTFSDHALFADRSEITNNLPRPVNCPANQVVGRLASNGQPTCVDRIQNANHSNTSNNSNVSNVTNHIPRALNCPRGTVLVGISRNLTPNCQPLGVVYQTAVRHTRARGGRRASACCNSNEILIGCSGSREDSAKDTCAEEVCAYVGTVVRGKCCITGVDSDRGTEAVADAFCMRVR